MPPYFYKDSLLNGFRATYWLSGSCTQDYGSVTVMQVTGTSCTGVTAYAVPFIHGNEPRHQIPFMYNFTPSAWKTQKVVRGVLNDEYSDGPGGLGGNDDTGQMGAWYVFAAMGFYPLDPVSGEYQLCSPLFDTATPRLPG